MEPLRHLLVTGSNAGTDGAGVPLVGGQYHGPEQARTSRHKAIAIPNSFRISVRVLSLGVAASIVGILLHAVAIWVTTKNVVQQQPNGTRQRAWPNHIDLWPTRVMLLAVAFAVVVQTLSLLTFCGGVGIVSSLKNLLCCSLLTFDRFVDFEKLGFTA
jgi:hypothetical protein